jgi:hypothetical protein
MHNRAFLSLTATIPPGETAHVRIKVQVPFRPGRLVISPQSFPPSLGRRLWTWLPVKIGNALGRMHRGLARLLHVDLYATHVRREYVSLEYMRAHPQEMADWHMSEEPEDETEDRPFVLVSIPLNRRERLLAPSRGAAKYLSQLRLRWQQAQLSTLLIQDITVSQQSQIVEGGSSLPADLFATFAIDAFVNFSSCPAGHEVTIEIYNGNRRKCQLVGAFIGTGLEPAPTHGNVDEQRRPPLNCN